MQQNKTYNYVLLDWDGNLARTLDVWLTALRTIMEEEGHFRSDEELAGSFGKVEDYMLSLGIKDPLAVYDRVNALAAAKLPEVELYPSALEALNHFKQAGKKTALITASNRANVAITLDRYDMHKLFDVIIAREDTKEYKPHPQTLFSALEQLGGKPDEAVMIGDSDKDMGAAQNAGVDSILFYPAEHTKFYDLEKLKQHKPTHVVDDFKKVIDIVK